MTQKLDDQLKSAERDKYLAEAEKAISEKAKLDFEFFEAQKEVNKKWYRKKEFLIRLWQGVTIAGLVIGFLTFFINYVIIPAYNKDNIALSTENLKKSDSLFKVQRKLDTEKMTIIADRKRLDTEINKNKLLNSYSDSVQKSLTNIKHVLASQKANYKGVISKKNDSLNKAISVFNMYYRITDSITSIKNDDMLGRVLTSFVFVYNGERIKDLEDISLYTTYNGRRSFFVGGYTEYGYSYHLGGSANKFVLRLRDSRYKLAVGNFEFYVTAEDNELDHRRKNYILQLNKK